MPFLINPTGTLLRRHLAHFSAAVDRGILASPFRSGSPWREFIGRPAGLAGRLRGFYNGALLIEGWRLRGHRRIAPFRKKNWIVYAKAPFAGPEAVLA